MLTVRKRPWVIRLVREAFYTCATPLQKIYWYLFRPYRPGAKMFVFHEGKLLLVRIGYAHKQWVLPGGGIERGEEPHDAAIREVQEESGITVSHPIYVGERQYTNQYKKVTVFYYTAEAPNREVTIDGQEIIDAGWFALDALPPDVATRVPEEIILYTDWKH